MDSYELCYTYFQSQKNVTWQSQAIVFFQRIIISTSLALYVNKTKITTTAMTKSLGNILRNAH